MPPKKKTLEGDEERRGEEARNERTLSKQEGELS